MCFTIRACALAAVFLGLLLRSVQGSDDVAGQLNTIKMAYGQITRMCNEKEDGESCRVALQDCLRNLLTASVRRSGRDVARNTMVETVYMLIHAEAAVTLSQDVGDSPQSIAEQAEERIKLLLRVYPIAPDGSVSQREKNSLVLTLGYLSAYVQDMAEVSSALRERQEELGVEHARPLEEIISSLSDCEVGDKVKKDPLRMLFEAGRRQALLEKQNKFAPKDK